MAKVAPFHSIKNNTPNVHHNNDKCTEGNNIERENKRAGTANRPLCQSCARLS